MRRNLFKLLLMTVTQCALVLSCAQTKQYTPRLASAGYELTGLPANVIQVQVNDVRSGSSQSHGLKEVIRAQILAALSTKPNEIVNRMYKLNVDIIEHRAFFTLGNWNASTRLRVKLIDRAGRILGQWDAEGSASRSNMWGYATAEAVSQDSYNIAVADMMSSLSQVSVRD